MSVAVTIINLYAENNFFTINRKSLPKANFLLKLGMSMVSGS